MKKELQALDKEKIVNINTFKQLRQEIKAKGLTITHCHGVFDLLHPGHIEHLKQAKSLGDILVVSVTAAPFVNKGPGRPHFSDDQRMQSLAALACIDYVVLSEFPTADMVIDAIQPDLYVKGKEYSELENDVTGAIEHEISRVQSYGGEVHFTDGDVFSSTKLLNNNFPVFPPGIREFIQEFSKHYSFDDVRTAVEQMRSVNVLVVGDIIIDQYVFCEIQGLMTKDRGLSARYSREEHYLGGSLAVARHMANFSDNVTVCGIMGKELEFHRLLFDSMGRTTNLELVYDDAVRTVVKRKYLERRGIRNEYEKVFSINYLAEGESAIEPSVRQVFYDKLDKLTQAYDLVVVSDYGHGLFDQQAMDIIRNKSRYTALNCQTNSSNYGTNLITKYTQADTFTLDEVELRLALSDKTSPVEELLSRLMIRLQAKTIWATLGSKGCMSIDSDLSIEQFPALTLNVQDTVGAGDAFYALSSLCAYTGQPACLGSFLGNIAGALAANVIGNSKSVAKSDLLKFAATMLNF
ncbi:MAG: PfkB family carbohydrate kinase [Acidobacteriota bacterium]